MHFQVNEWEFRMRSFPGKKTTTPVPIVFNA